jgi:hypothetical protein
MSVILWNLLLSGENLVARIRLVNGNVCGSGSQI